MATICPTITAETAEQYQAQADKIAPFATRWHIDAADGVFAPRRLLDLDKLWWPGNVQVDLHAMYKNPAAYVDVFIALRPRLLIIHAEADGDYDSFAAELRKHGIEVGVALLPQTPVSLIVSSIEKIDHVLVFSGNLGYQGGSSADLNLLQKVAELKRLKPTLEVGWDGGVNDQNARQLAEGGVDVLNVGGFIQTAAGPQAAYDALKTSVSGL